MKAAERSEAKNLKVGVGFMWRHSEARQEVIQRIHDGEIGRVDAMRIYRVHGPVHCPALPGEAEVAALMGRMATHTGQYVTWDQAIGSKFQFVADIDNMNYDTPAPIHEGPDGIYPCPMPGLTNEI